MNDMHDWLRRFNGRAAARAAGTSAAQIEVVGRQIWVETQWQNLPPEVAADAYFRRDETPLAPVAARRLTRRVCP